MDDNAASQQLLEEQASSQHAPTAGARAGSNFREGSALLTYRTTRSGRRPRGSAAERSPVTSADAPPSRMHASADRPNYANRGEENNSPKVCTKWPPARLRAPTVEDSTPEPEVHIPDSQILAPPASVASSTPDLSGRAVFSRVFEHGGSIRRSKRTRRSHAHATVSPPLEDSMHDDTASPSTSEVIAPNLVGSKTRRRVSTHDEMMRTYIRTQEVAKQHGDLTPVLNKISRPCTTKALVCAGPSQDDQFDGIIDSDDHSSGQRARSLRLTRRLKTVEPPHASGVSETVLAFQPQNTESVNSSITSNSAAQAVANNDVRLVDLPQHFAPMDTAPIQKQSSIKKRLRRATEIYDWSAPVRNLGEPFEDNIAFNGGGARGTASHLVNTEDTEQPSDCVTDAIRDLSDSKDANGDPCQAMDSSTDDNDDSVCLSPSASIKDERTSISSIDQNHVPAWMPTNRPIESQHTAYPASMDPKECTNLTDASTATDRALEIVRELNHPPHLLSSGDFSPDEQEIVRRAIRSYQEWKELDKESLLEIIHWSTDHRDHSITDPADDFTLNEESTEFWGDMKLVQLTRTLDEVRNHIRSRYHEFEIGPWSTDEDDMLKDAVAQHPEKWRIIAQLSTNRSRHDVETRWQNRIRPVLEPAEDQWSVDELVNTSTDEACSAAVEPSPSPCAIEEDPPSTHATAEDGTTHDRLLLADLSATELPLKSPVMLSELALSSSPPADAAEVEPLLSSPVMASQVESPPNLFVDPDSSSSRGVSPVGTDQLSSSPLLPAQVELPSNMTARLSRTEPLTWVSNEIATRASQSSCKSRNRDNKDQVLSRTLDRSRSPHKTQKPGTPNSANGPILLAESSPGVAQMLSGDKFSLAAALVECNFETEAIIDWHKFKTVEKSLWSVRTLQAALQELKGAAGIDEDDRDRGTFLGVLLTILDYLVKEHGDKLHEKYDHHPHFDTDDEVVRTRMGDDYQDLRIKQYEAQASSPTDKKRKRVDGMRRGCSKRQKQFTFKQVFTPMSFEARSAQRALAKSEKSAASQNMILQDTGFRNMTATQFAWKRNRDGRLKSTTLREVALGVELDAPYATRREGESGTEVAPNEASCTLASYPVESRNHGPEVVDATSSRLKLRWRDPRSTQESGPKDSSDQKRHGMSSTQKPRSQAIIIDRDEDDGEDGINGDDSDDEAGM